MRDYNIFISHSWSHSDNYERLIEMLKKASYFSFRDFSVPKNDPIHNAPNSQALYNAIKQQISPASVVLILAGVYASYSSWIEKEIRIAQSEFSIPKKILAIELWGSEKTSQIVKNNSNKIVGWNGQSIADTIKELANE